MTSFNEWLLQRGKADNTIKTYEKGVSNFMLWLESEGTEIIDFNEIRAIDLREYKKYLLRTAKKKNGKPLALRTVNTYIESVKVYFQFLKKTRVIKHDPSEGLKVQNVKNEEIPRWLDKTEKRSLLRVIEDPVLKGRNPWLYSRNRAIVYLSLHGGLRIGEKVHLTVHDIKNGYIHVREAKGNSARLVPINKSLAKVIDEWIQERNKLKPNTDAFLVSQKGGSLSASGIYNLFENLVKKTNIQELTPHTLRHTFAHNLLEAGNPLPYVADLLGHIDINTTKIYTKPRKSNLKDAVDSISDD